MTQTKRIYAMRVFLITSIFLLPACAHAGVFSAIFGFMAEAEYFEEENALQNPQVVPLLHGVTNSDPVAAYGGGDIIIDEDGMLVPGMGATNGTNGKENTGEISQYVVRESDSLSEIASMFGVSVNTILWANEIKNPNTIQPGDTLIILPVSGVSHIVKKGDSLKAIATKYRGDVDDIIAYNRLLGEDDLKPGATIVVPGGEVAPPPAPKKAVATTKGGAKGGSTASSGSFIHPLPGMVKRTQGIHGYNGVDLAAPVGTAVRASAGGEVIISRSSGWNGGYGAYIVIKHKNGTQTLYSHLSRDAVSVGQVVAQGETIGAVGSTGQSTGPHLHFEVRGAKNPF